MHLTRPTWDEYFLGIAAAVSQRADCRRRRVGAVLVAQHRIVATGYNGSSHGCVNTRSWDGMSYLFDSARIGDKVIVYWS